MIWIYKYCSENDFGQSIFPKFVLAEKGIMTRSNKQEKHRISAYPPWDNVIKSRLNLMLQDLFLDLAYRKYLIL
ncbi:MepB family protein [Pedobacter sp. AJM]|uniref:MepB family protein n=1 Tax=Pedobacter sp. AJM TaxID=2003629 RepID=UPI000B4A7FD2|nr:hypothetical protein CBW18_06965 [Pedobacter sp. AJM]